MEFGHLEGVPQPDPEGTNTITMGQLTTALRPSWGPILQVGGGISRNSALMVYGWSRKSHHEKSKLHLGIFSFVTVITEKLPRPLGHFIITWQTNKPTLTNKHTSFTQPFTPIFGWFFGDFVHWSLGGSKVISLSHLDVPLEVRIPMVIGSVGYFTPRNTLIHHL